MLAVLPELPRLSRALTWTGPFCRRHFTRCFPSSASLLNSSSERARKWFRLFASKRTGTGQLRRGQFCFLELSAIGRALALKGFGNRHAIVQDDALSGSFALLAFIFFAWNLIGPRRLVKIPRPATL
jgi:hypothetical protein